MSEQGLKYDEDKPSIELVDPEFLEGLASVLDFGAKKYAAHNWRGGIKYSRLIGAAYRHLGAINKGEDVDRESHLPHVYHLACCVMFLASMMNKRKDLDDRYKEDNVSIKPARCNVSNVGGAQSNVSGNHSYHHQTSGLDDVSWMELQMALDSWKNK